ncbi:T9SS type B sorting domain-containing protein [Aequorivita echinoideorum]|uniref:T9SS type B sorting domain-containing protein n=1 Tax=Aequorivita echinoideorum TaxID=1549647 RepID=A0ABS5S2W5_9FLAO|nr:choice-of-anchor L domain-containing protein [Aequorivita echinoideorum]MBT0606779.1 T9SS type B sorting domain-containing protein [Aequorivita echinoideorum]
MKFLIHLLIALGCASSALSQNLQIDATTYTPQQLIEDILIDSGCIENVQISQTIGGNFQDGDKSFGYFSANDSNFPFEKGLVLSTGKLANVPGPNNSLSDDDAPGWGGDQDLENALNISNTTNATIIEFDFIPKADNIQFRYLFASEEYQEGSPNTCIYSDAFAFLIKPIGGNYTNIAVVPGTNTPVLVTTVHSGIPGSCPPINANYFEGWNGTNVPINFNGQTKVLVAEAPVVIDQPYHIKLVIADEVNYRYDSAVFLEGGSFNIAANLGPDRSFATQSPLCDDEVYILDATPEGTTPEGYKWFRNGNLIPGENTAQLTVTTAGVYSVEVDFGNDCIAHDEVTIDYADPITVFDTELVQCDPGVDGRATFNLFDAQPNVTNGNTSLEIASFHKSFENAQNNLQPIVNPSNYTNTIAEEVVYARVVSILGCVGVAAVTLKTTANTLSDFNLAVCSNPETPGFGTFNLSEITAEIIAIYGNAVTVNYYATYNQAIAQVNELSLPYTNTVSGIQTIYVRISGEIGCVGTAAINLRVLDTPEFQGPTEYIYCLNTFPRKIRISAGVVGTQSDLLFEWSTGETTSSIEVNEAGTFTINVTRRRPIFGENFTCSASKTFTVIASEPPQVTYQLSGNLGSETVTILASGEGDYLYSLDGSSFSENFIFENVGPGIHTAVVIDANGCGSTTIEVFVLGFPNYFTPNNDGHHDFWEIKGVNYEKYQLARVEIFDRFGKMLYTLRRFENGWDGTYRGRPVPSSDYWFKAVFNDGRFHRGHFTLKR